MEPAEQNGLEKPYAHLLNIVKGKGYFVLTTNVGHQFQLAGFDKKRLFYAQGDYGLWQCSKACHDKTYDREEIVLRMVATQKNLNILFLEPGVGANTPAIIKYPFSGFMVRSSVAWAGIF